MKGLIGTAEVRRPMRDKAVLECLWEWANHLPDWQTTASSGRIGPGGRMLMVVGGRSLDLSVSLTGISFARRRDVDYRDRCLLRIP